MTALNHNNRMPLGTLSAPAIAHAMTVGDGVVMVQTAVRSNGRFTADSHALVARYVR